MSWFRSAALYLVLVAIFLGTVWLFWGQSLEKAWKKAKETPLVKDKIPKEFEKRKADLKKVEIPRLPEAQKLVEKLPANAAAEWQKTRSGVTGLVEAQKYENTRDLHVLAGKHDNRMIEILRQTRLLSSPRPSAEAVKPLPYKGEVNAIKPAEKKVITKTKVKPKRQENNTAPLRPMF